jgi:hypothetical protein
LGGLTRALSAAITVAFHDDLVGVVGEAVECALGEDGIIEEWDPLVDGPVGGDDGGGAAVALDDDLVEVAGLLGVESPKTEVVDNEEIRSEEATDNALGGVIGPGLVDELEERVAAKEEDAAAGATGAMAESAGEEGLAHADGPEEKDVLVTFEESEAEEISDAVAVEGDGSVPVKVLEGMGLLEAGAVEAGGEVLVFPAIDLVLKGELEEVEGGEGGLLGIGDAVRKGGCHAGELEALENGA